MKDLDRERAKLSDKRENTRRRKKRRRRVNREEQIRVESYRKQKRAEVRKEQRHIGNQEYTQERKEQETIDSGELQDSQDILRKERNKRKDEERVRRREIRRRKVMIQKITIAAVLVLLVCGVGGGILLNQASFRLSRKLSAGDKYTAGGDYEAAQTAYEEALQIDPTTVEAYRCLAQNNQEQNDNNAAKEILYTGWETTQDESLLHYYCTLVLNEAVTEINEKNCSLESVNKCIHVLQEEPENRDAVELLYTCYDRLFTGSGEENASESFMDVGRSADTCQYGAYEQVVRSLLALYEESHSDAVKGVLAKYAVIDYEYVYLSMPHLESYHTLLEDVGAVVSDTPVTELAACLARAIEVESDFADIFTAFEQGRYESAREFIVGDMYQQLQDSFINKESGYWEGADSIPINKEQMVIHRTENGFTFFWPGYEDYENPQGVITVWGSRHLDDGVQRTTISYEPAGTADSYYPHTEYVITYEYSNVLKNGTSVQMNYRFTTQVTTEEGMTKNAIGDWGGEHEWEIEY